MNIFKLNLSDKYMLYSAIGYGISLICKLVTIFPMLHFFLHKKLVPNVIDVIYNYMNLPVQFI